MRRITRIIATGLLRCIATIVPLHVMGRVAHRRPGESGMTTAEYAIGTVAAASFAALLIKLLTSDEVRSLLMGIIQAALGLAG